MTNFSLNQEEIRVQVKVTDCVSGDPFDVSDIIDQKIIFYKPNGLRLVKQADLVVDTENPGQFFVQFQGEIPSFLDDKTSNWEFSAEIQLVNNAIAETTQRTIIWVK